MHALTEDSEPGSKVQVKSIRRVLSRDRTDSIGNGLSAQPHSEQPA